MLPEVPLRLLLAILTAACVGPAPVEEGPPSDRAPVGDTDPIAADTDSDIDGDTDRDADTDPGATYVLPYAPEPVAGCTVFPADTFFHADVRTLPLHPSSATWLDHLGRDRPLRVPAKLNTSDPWAPVRYGVPMNLADADTPRRTVIMDGFYPVDRQYTGPYPLPPGLDVQTGFDQQTIVLETDACESYELIGYSDILAPAANGGAKWDLSTHDHLPLGHGVTAPGLPLLGLQLQAEEVRRGRVDHVLAFSLPDPAKDVEGPDGDPLWPALRSDGQSTDPDAVRMGAWFRLRADVDTSQMPDPVRVVAEALRVHGAILGDTGGLTDAVVFKLQKTDDWEDAAGDPVDGLLARLGEWITVGDLEVVDPTGMRSGKGSLAIR